MRSETKSDISFQESNMSVCVSNVVDINVMIDAFLGSLSWADDIKQYLDYPR